MNDPVYISFLAMAIILLVWAAIDLYKSNFQSALIKIIWLIVILVAPLFGAVAYFTYKSFKDRNTRKRKKSKLKFKRKSLKKDSDDS